MPKIVLREADAASSKKLLAVCDDESDNKLANGLIVMMANMKAHSVNFDIDDIPCVVMFSMRVFLLRLAERSISVEISSLPSGDIGIEPSECVGESDGFDSSLVGGDVFPYSEPLPIDDCV